MKINFFFFANQVNFAKVGCRLGQCQNGGTCIDQPNSFYGYSCICPAQWMGVNCDQSEFKTYL